MKKGIYKIYCAVVLLQAVFYLGYTYAPKQEIVIDFKPIYRDAIKAVDPFEILKDNTDTHKDYATF